MLLIKQLDTLDESLQKEIVGGGIRYTFDANGNYWGPIETVEDGNYIVVQGAYDEPHPISGFLSSLSLSTTYPQSGASLIGDELNDSAFKYLSKNTNVEWAYCYKDGEPGGFITTQNNEHSVGLPEDAETFMQRGYDSIMHNHGQDLSGLGYTYDETVAYNSLPSNSDIGLMEQYGFENAHIYNEFDNQSHRYNSNTESQEQYRYNHGWE